MKVDQVIQSIVDNELAHRELSVVMRALLNSKKSGLSEQSFRVLNAIAMTPSCAASDVAASTAILGPSVSRILSKLRDGGLIIIHSSMRDGRAIDLRATSKGKKLVDSIKSRGEQR
jgi:DNA-binding MarR family transcriptional regulator